VTSSTTRLDGAARDCLLKFKLLTLRRGTGRRPAAPGPALPGGVRVIADDGDPSQRAANTTKIQLRRSKSSQGSPDSKLKHFRDSSIFSRTFFLVVGVCLLCSLYIFSTYNFIAPSGTTAFEANSTFKMADQAEFVVSGPRGSEQPPVQVINSR
jgi:hypothetical protein